MVSFQSAWPYPAQAIHLPHNEVHVWAASLNRPAAQLERLWSILASAEQKRADRFYFERDRNHYVAARGLLRTLLGLYLQLAPQAVAFTYGEHGKPALAPSLARGDVRFNISHAQGVALCSFTRGREIGVDVEQIRPLDDASQIAERFFSAHEVQVFTAVPPAQKPEAFFNCWTRKEAFIKAIGEGLSCPLDSFDVALAPGEPARLLQIKGSPEMAARWQLHTLTPAAGYVGAVIAEGREWTLRRWQWPATLTH